MVTQLNNIKNFCGYKNTKSQNFVANRLPRFSSKDELILASKNDDISSEIDYLKNLNSKELSKMVISIVKTGSEKSGCDATVFDISGCKNLVLRVDNELLEIIDYLGHNYKLVPIKHNNEIIQNNNLGIPLLALVENSSILANKEYLLPNEACSDTYDGEILILRKVDGQNPAENYYQSFTKFLGIKPYDYAQFAYFSDFKDYIFKLKDNNAAINFLDSCKKGEYKQNNKYQFSYGVDNDSKDQKTFYKNYTDFVKNYFIGLDNIANLPQKSFDKAVADIISLHSGNEARFDFVHTNNTYVDFEKKCFNFVDIEFNPHKLSFFDYKDPIIHFAQVLFGKNASCEYGLFVYPDPYSLIVCENDKKLLNEKIEKISEKISKACKANKFNWTSDELLRRLTEK